MAELLSADEKKELLQRARRAGASALGLEPAPPLPAPSGTLSAPGAAFVTWKRDGRLRGCIGSVEPRRTLAQDVEENAVAALIHDPRFPPATAREFPRYLLEVSVLGALERIEGPAAVTIGRDGLFVERGKRRGLLLPQVPLEWGWDAGTFVEQVCLKAGLPPDGWQAGHLWRFSAEVFGEEG